MNLFPTRFTLLRRLENKKKLIIVFGILSHVSFSANAENLLDNDRFDRTIPHVPIRVNPFEKTGQVSTKLRLLNNLNLMDFSKIVEKQIAEKLQAPYLRIKQKSPQGAHLTNDWHDRDIYEMSINGIPLCDYEVRAAESEKFGIYMIGKIPKLDQEYYAEDSEWQDYNELVDVAEDWIVNKGVNVESSSLISKSKCYFIENAKPTPVWQLTMRINGLSYKFWANQDKIYKFENGFFDLQGVDGKLVAYKKNPTDGATQTYQVPLKGTKKLDSIYFTTVVHNGQRAEEANHEFLYDVNDPHFPEVTTFAHASLTFEFFRALGYKWVGPQPLDLHVHKIIGNTKNNALYEPSDSTGTGFPAISIGDGDGQILRNLPLDSDVVGHEFGHHVVYSTLKTISGESLILHEGLADFFNFSKNNDPCLGESICPTGSKACWVQNKCLRTADNTIKYQDETYSNMSAHPRSQIVSGLLWDLYKKHGVALADVTKLTFGATQKFIKQSGFYDFILGLMLTDQEKFAGKYSCKIHQAAVDRGLDEIISSLNCTEPKGWGSMIGGGGVGDSSGITEEEKEESNKLSKRTCGTLNHFGKNKNTNFSEILGILILMLPLFVVRYRD